MNKIALTAFVGLGSAILTATPVFAADLPTFSASDTSVYAGQVVTITATPGTGDQVAPFGGPDNFADICAGVWGSGDTYGTDQPHFSLGGEFTQDSGVYAPRKYPGDPVVNSGLNIQYASAGWGDFTPNLQSSAFTFDFTIPDDVSVDAQNYTLKMSCISPNFWLRDRMTIVQYPIAFTIVDEPNSGGSGSSGGSSDLARTGITAEPLVAAGLMLVAGGLGIVVRNRRRNSN